ncbi:MAG TPA: ribosome maturation factor RimP [Gemmatimonadales bacterium]|nr:ribosome maturation factor RimP [Gemmatimonadales bacterium]
MTTALPDLTAEIRERVDALGFELVDVRHSGSRRARLQVRIDRPDSIPGRGVTIADCQTVSRALEQWLDETGLLGADYVLEVSSPGIERPVRWPEHWERFTGRDVMVRLPGRGRVRATIVGVDRGAGTVTLRLVQEVVTISVSLADVRDARLAVDWD